MDSLNMNHIFGENQHQPSPEFHHSRHNIHNVPNIQTESKSEDLGEKVLRFSFYITYAFLMTTATVTFIESMTTSDNKARNILNLETCISIVAAFFYGVFMKKINQKNINYKEINVNRYVDWSITTPIMLLVLILAFTYNTGQSVALSSFLIILALNYGMLLSGF